VAFGVFVAACGHEGEDPDVSGLKRRASFETHCAISQLKAFHIDEDTMGVFGCGTRLVYVRVCRGILNEECQWVLNSDARRGRE
jgi:hypothetical protein